MAQSSTIPRPARQSFLPGFEPEHPPPPIIDLADPAEVAAPIWTARFGSPALAASGLVAVRTSVGRPRWVKVHTEIAVAATLVPFGIFGKIEDRDEYTRRYLARLDRFGVEKVMAELEAISQAHGGAPLALLCYCSLERPGAWCHRRLAAAWLEEQTGLRVPELREGGAR